MQAFCYLSHTHLAKRVASARPREGRGGDGVGAEEKKEEKGKKKRKIREERNNREKMAHETEIAIEQPSPQSTQRKGKSSNKITTRRKRRNNTARGQTTG